MNSEIPSCAWKMPLAGTPTRLGKPRGFPRRFILRMIPIYFRIRSIQKRAEREGKTPPGINIARMIDDGYNQGIPIGGLGAGSIGRSYLGDFARWHLQIGYHEYAPSLPNQFHL
ncbi:MAG: GH116 family glycosyl-hydrolase, partial [Promethearchaeota archaeon]